MAAVGTRPGRIRRRCGCVCAGAGGGQPRLGSSAGRSIRSADRGRGQGAPARICWRLPTARSPKTSSRARRVCWGARWPATWSATSSMTADCGCSVRCMPARYWPRSNFAARRRSSRFGRRPTLRPNGPRPGRRSCGCLSRKRICPRRRDYVGLVCQRTGRPDVSEARVVVSGGRAIQSREDFERLVGGLADALRRRDRQHPLAGRRGHRAERVPGGADRQDHRAGSVHRLGPFRLGPAPGGHEELQDSSWPSIATRRRRFFRRPTTAWWPISMKRCRN